MIVHPLIIEYRQAMDKNTVCNVMGVLCPACFFFVVDFVYLCTMIAR